MIDTGLLAINGVPGSGKTLTATDIALKHYKRENRWYKYYFAVFKHKLSLFINNNKFLLKIKSIFNKLKSITFVKFLFYFMYYFFNFFLILCLLVNFSIYTKIVILYYLFKHKKFFKSLSSIDYEYYQLFPDHRINNVYSSYPILLDKKRNIWSRKFSFYDMNNKWSFYPNSLLITDEIQLFVDSDEYADKDQKPIIADIAKFLQSHRHFGIKQIIFTSQSPTRIFKKGRNIVVGYLKQFKIINLPFSISIARGIIYYDFEYYGHHIPKDRKEREKLPFDYKKVIRIFIRNKVYNAYDSRYLSLYNYNKPLLNKGYWDNYKTDYAYLKDLFDPPKKKPDVKSGTTISTKCTRRARTS